MENADQKRICLFFLRFYFLFLVFCYKMKIEDFDTLDEKGFYAVHTV